MNFDPLRQSLAERVITTAIIVIAVLLILAFVGWCTGRWEQNAQAQPMVLTLPPTKWDQRMLELDKQALDEAYIAKIKHIFDIYVREGLASQEGIMKGHAQAQRAYIQAQQAIEIREKVLEERERLK